MKAEDKKLLKETLLSTKKSLFYILIIWFLAIIGVPLVIIVGLVSAYIIVEGLWSKKKLSTIFKQVILLLLVVSIAFWLYGLFGAYGFLGLLLVAVLFATYIIITRWKQYMFWIRHIEKRFLYGETLEERRKKK